MPIALRPFANKYVLIAAGVLLGLLAIALMLMPATSGAHADIVKGAASQFAPADGSKVVAMGVLWH